MSHVDEVMRDDLRALGEDSEQRLPALEALTSTLLGNGTPYRDDAPGAEARRRSLLEERLLELASMPLAFERVFVHRVARAAAGAMALLGVALAVLASSDPWTYRLVYMVVGYPTAPLAGALLAAGVLAAYVGAVLIAERYYERRVRGLLAADRGTYDDIERLAARGPSDEAMQLIDRVDAAAVALPLAGAAGGGLLLGLLAFFSDPGYSAFALIAESRATLVPAILAAVAAGVALGTACGRDRREPERSLLVRAGEHWLALALGCVALVGALWYAARTAFGLHAYGFIPTDATSTALGLIGLAALLLPAGWALLRLRRREHARLRRGD